MQTNACCLLILLTIVIIAIIVFIRHNDANTKDPEVVVLDEHCGLPDGQVPTPVAPPQNPPILGIINGPLGSLEANIDVNSIITETDFPVDLTSLTITEVQVFATDTGYDPRFGPSPDFNTIDILTLPFDPPCNMQAVTCPAVGMFPASPPSNFVSFTQPAPNQASINVTGDQQLWTVNHDDNGTLLITTPDAIALGSYAMKVLFTVDDINGNTSNVGCAYTGAQLT